MPPLSLPMQPEQPARPEQPQQPATTGQPMTGSFLIRGVTRAGRRFRPSDWAERLCGVMSSFQPGAIGAGLGMHLQYSPWVQPLLGEDVKCVRVDGRLEAFSAMAYRFVVNFAHDNDLQVESLGPAPAAQTPAAKTPAAQTPATQASAAPADQSGSGR